MKRILIVRTDRIGDVVLSTPVIKTVRRAIPDAYIAMMVAPAARELVEGNPGLDETIIFDKKKSGGLIGTLGFASALRKRKFDTVFVLHPTTRVHLILWLSGIRQRIGLDKKGGFLLTKKIAHTKQQGEKHEIDYNLDLLRAAGIDVEGADRLPFVPVKKQDKDSIGNILRENGFSDNAAFVVIHPGASCLSKRWPAERFASVADEVIKRFNKKIVIIAGANDGECGGKVADEMENESLNLSGDLSIGELAALLERADLLISNDSGPVHIAVALGVPVVAIFGRKQRGLGPKRWGPAGKNDIVLHKDAGCIECMAHDCASDFKCLDAVKTDEVIAAAGKLLGLKGKI